MNSAKGYYSLIQYCPDRARMEAANIGVLLLCPELDFLDLRMSKGNERVCHFFGKDSFKRAHVDSAKKALKHRLKVDRERLRTSQDLVTFAKTRGNDILVTLPRSIRVSSPEIDLDNLFDELVGGQRRRVRRKDCTHALDEAFARPSLQDRIKRINQKIAVPVMDENVHVLYAYQNGACNYIKPQVFSSKRREATTTAIRLAMQGDLLRKHPEGGEDRQLIVVSAFEDQAAYRELGGSVSKILGHLEVRSVNENEIEEFAKEIEREAH